MWDNRADIAGDSMFEHCAGEKEVHGVGYETLGKNTVLYNSKDPCLLGDVARRELENFEDFVLRILSCSVSVRSQDFHTPKYLNWSYGDFTLRGVGELDAGSNMTGEKELSLDRNGWPCLSNCQMIGIV